MDVNWGTLRRSGFLLRAELSEERVARGFLDVGHDPAPSEPREAGVARTIT